MSEPIPIPLAGFEGRGLSLRQPGFWTGVALLCDGAPVPRQGGVYALKDNAGAAVALKFRRTPFDPIPKIDANGQVIVLAPPLAWYDYVLIILPIGLVGIGGIIGGVCGAMGAYFNTQVARLPLPAPLRILIALGVTLAAAAVWFGIVLLIAMLTYRGG